MMILAFPVEDTVQLRAQQNAERRDVKPNESGNSGRERSVEAGVVGDAGDIPAVSERGRKPDDGASDGAGRDPEPTLRPTGTEMVKSSEDGENGGKADRPTDHPPKENYGVAQVMAGVRDHPVLDLVAEDDRE